MLFIHCILLNNDHDILNKSVHNIELIPIKSKYIYKKVWHANKFEKV